MRHPKSVGEQSTIIDDYQNGGGGIDRSGDIKVSFGFPNAANAHADARDTPRA